MPNPRTQQECKVQIRLFVQAQMTVAIDKFRKAIFYNGMRGYCGLRLAVEWRTMDPKPFVQYFPALVSQEKVALSVSFVGEEEYEGVTPEEPSAISVPEGRHRVDPAEQCDYNHSPIETPTSFGPTISRPLTSSSPDLETKVAMPTSASGCGLPSLALVSILLDKSHAGFAACRRLAAKLLSRAVQIRKSSRGAFCCL